MSRKNVTVKIEGLLDVKKSFAELAGESESIEKMVSESMQRIQLGSFKRAPYLTGLLSSSLMAPENVVKQNDGKTIAEELIESIPYATIQEFTNRRKPAFIRTSTSEEFPVVMRSFKQWADSLGGR